MVIPCIVSLIHELTGFDILLMVLLKTSMINSAPTGYTVNKTKSIMSTEPGWDMVDIRLFIEHLNYVVSHLRFQIE
jgi:hypothetical protein